MRWTHRLLGLAIFSLPLIVLTVASVIYLIRLADYLSPRLAPVVAQIAAESINREVRIGRVTPFDRPGYVNLQDVEISNAPTFAQDEGAPAISIKHAEIVYSLPFLLSHPSGAVGAIELVKLDSPALFVERLRSGSFNFSDLLVSKHPTNSQPFVGVVTVTDGSAIIKDDSGPGAAQRIPQRLHHLKARVDLRSTRVVTFSMTAQGDENIVHTLAIRGQFLRGGMPAKGRAGRATRGYGLDVQFAGANLAHFAPYLVPRPSIRAAIFAGSGKGEVTVKQVGPAHSPLKISGNISVKGAAVRLLGGNVVTGPIDGVVGNAQFTENSVTFAGAAVLSGQRVSAVGTVLDFHKPQVYASVNGKAIAYSKLRLSLRQLPAIPDQIGLSSPIAAQTWVSGYFSQPSFDVSVQIPTLLASGYRLNNVDADFTYAHKQLTVHSASADTASGGGRYSASGVVDVSGSTPTYQIYGQAKSIDILGLPLSHSIAASLLPLHASISATFDASNQGISAQLASTNGVIHGVPYEAAQGDVFYKPGDRIRVEKLFVRQQKSGIMVVTGDIPQAAHSDGLNLQFRAAQLDLSTISPAFSKTPISGLAYIKGSLTGSVSSPEVKSHILVLQPAYGQYSLNLVTADLSGNENLLRVDKLVVRDVPGTAQATGTIVRPLSTNPHFDLDVGLRDLPVSYLTMLGKTGVKASSSDLPLTGFVGGTASVTGDVKDPVIDASLMLENGTYQDFQLTNSSARVEYAKGALAIEAFRLSAAGVNFAGSGAYYPGPDTISLDLNATANDLGLVTRKYAPSLQIFGGLQVAANVDGPVKSPSFTATISTKDVSVEGTKLSISPCTFNYSDNKLAMTRGPLSVTADASHYKLDAINIDFANHLINAKGSEEGETLTHLISVVQKSPYLESHIGDEMNSVLAKMPAQPVGDLNISSVTVSGNQQHPAVTVSAELTSASIAGQTIDRLQADLSVKSTLVSVTNFRLVGPNNVFLELGGTIDTAGPVNAKLEASGFNLSLLDPFLPSHPRAGGVLSDLSLVASGETRAPEISASVTLSKPSYNGFVLDRIDSGEIDIRSSHISVNGLTFTKSVTSSKGAGADHTITVDGSIPFDWKKDAVLQGEIPTDVPIALNASVPLQSIDFINQIDPDFPVKMPAGTIAGHVKVTGTIADKQVNGELSINNATMQSDSFQTSFKNINLDVSLDGKQFTVHRFNADSSFGGSINVAGGGQFSGVDVLGAASTDSLLSDLQLDLTVSASNLILNERKIALFNNAGLSVRINNKLTFTGQVLKPLIQGELSVDKVIGSLPQTSSQPNDESAIPIFNPRFDITVDIKPEAQIKTAQLNAMADGSIVLAGSLYRPRLDGTFLIRKGQFYFPTATFKVVPVGTVGFHFRPPEVVSETIQMTAVTSITVSPDIIARNPAGANTTATYVPPSVTSNTAATSQRYTVTVNIDGDLETPDHLHLTFESNPPGLTDAQILAVLGGQEAIAGLTGGNIVSALQNQMASVFNASVVPKMLQPLEDTIGAVLGLEDFSIDYAPESPVQVTIVKRLGSRLSVQYTQSVNSRTPGAVSSTLEPPVYQVKLGYSFTPRLQATISTDDQHNNIVAIEGVHNF